SNFLEMFAILGISAGLTYTYGVMVGSRREGWAVFWTMMAIFLGGLVVALVSEYHPNPIFPGLLNMEGKETRFGIANSILWGVSTTDTYNGSVNAMHSSMSALAGGVDMFNMALGC